MQKAGALALVVAMACGKSSSSSPPNIDLKLGEADLAPLASAVDRLVRARAADPDDTVIRARTAEAEGLALLLYGNPVSSDDVFAPGAYAPGGAGWSEWAIGKAAYELARVKSKEQLHAVDDLLGELAKTDNNDPWRRWLQGRAAQAAGDRVRARAAIANVPLEVATIDRANLDAEDGHLANAERALAAAAPHVLVTATRAIIRAELGDVRGAVADADAIAAGTSLPPRLAAYQLVARALIGLANERYDLVAGALDKLGSQREMPSDCVLWERISWLHLQLGRPGKQGRGDQRAAVVARQRCALFPSGQVAPDPRLQQVDAAIALAYGRPEHAIGIVDHIEHLDAPGLLDARTVGAEAELELGKARAALARLKPTPNDIDALPGQRVARVLRLEATAIASDDAAHEDARAAAIAKLVELAGTAHDQRARHALGAAFVAIGDRTAAKRELRRVVEETSVASPDPLGYRTHLLLAEIALSESDLDTANHEVDRALEIHAGNVEMRVMQARILVRRGEFDRALGVLAPIRKQGPLPARAQLVVAEALVSRKDPTADQRAQATALVTGLVGKVPAAELGRVAALVDPKLPRKLALPVGKLPPRGT